MAMAEPPLKKRRQELDPIGADQPSRYVNSEDMEMSPELPQEQQQGEQGTDSQAQGVERVKPGEAFKVHDVDVGGQCAEEKSSDLDVQKGIDSSVEADAGNLILEPTEVVASEKNAAPLNVRSEEADAKRQHRNAEEANLKRQHRNEIRIVYRAYRTLKSCLTRHPVLGQVELDRELDKAFATLIRHANGCTAVRRIAAELIPRYAVFCPTALDAASREEANDAVVGDTAEACFSGLVQLSIAANSVAASFLGLADMCAGVCRSVAYYLLSSLNGNDIFFEEVPLNKSLASKEDLARLISRCMGKLFWYDPENVFAACFELLQADDPKRRKHGLHFISQIVASEEEMDVDKESDGPMIERKGSNIITKVLHPKPALERWIVSVVQTFRKLEKPEIVEESLPSLLTLIKSFGTFVPSDLELPPQDQEPNRMRRISRLDDGFVTGSRSGRLDRGLRAVSPEVDGWFKEKEARRRSQAVTTHDADIRNRDRKDEESIGWRRKRLGTDGEIVKDRKEQSPKASPPADTESGPMDVLMASEHLWVGGFGTDVTESILKTQFSGFGQLDDVALFKDRGFALVQYKNIKDAVEAREEMHGSTMWGKPIRVKFLDSDKGVVGSSHLWVGRISSQAAKEELMRDLIGAGLKPPVSVVPLISSSALLIECDGPDEANAVMVHIRQRRRGVPCNVDVSVNRHLWVGRVDPLVSEEEIISAFSQYGEVTGWKFIRQSGCCFIDFQSTEDAATARIRLNGARFGSQAVVVEFKNILHKNASPRRRIASPPGTSKAVLSATLENMCSKFALDNASAGTPGSQTGKPRINKFSNGPRDERAPTNILYVSLPETVSPGFMNESELKSIFDVACDGMGTVTKVRSTRTTRGPCRIVEFDGIDAACTALQNIMGHFDSRIQMSFSSAYQVTDHPLEYTRRRDRGVSRGDKDQDYEEYGSPSTELDESRGKSRPREVREEGYHRKHDPGGASPSTERESTPGKPPVTLVAPLTRVSSTNSCDPLSPASASTPRLRSVTHSSLQSPVTPAVKNPPGFDQPGLQASPPPPPPPLPADTPPPPPVEPPPPQSPPPPPPPEGVDTKRNFWRGPLCKSGLQYCEVTVCREETSRGKYDGGRREPTGWPDKLDVTKRADFRSLKQTFNNCAPNQREVCRLHACASSEGKNHNGFANFMDYLKQRDRAGVVKIPGVEGLWPRMLYILPWAAEAAELLSVSAEPADSLLCVVLPCLHP